MLTMTEQTKHNMTQATASATARRGEPASAGERLGLPKIVCWNCQRIIATGVIPPIVAGDILVIQCGHKDCRAYNKFEGK